MDEREQVFQLANYLEGLYDGTKGSERQRYRLNEAVSWLQKLANNMCSQGFIGCPNGRCTSDHK